MIFLDYIYNKVYAPVEDDFGFDDAGDLDELDDELQMEALWDRFVIRIESRPIKKESNFRAMLLEVKSEERRVKNSNAITAEEYAEWSENINKISVKEEVLEISGFTDAELWAYDKFWDSVSVETFTIDCIISTLLIC